MVHRVSHHGDHHQHWQYADPAVVAVLDYTAGQQVELGWNGEYSQGGNRVTVAAASWNTDIDPGMTVSTGFTGSHSGSNPAPSAFTLNGASCTTR